MLECLGCGTFEGVCGAISTHRAAGAPLIFCLLMCLNDAMRDRSYSVKHSFTSRPHSLLFSTSHSQVVSQPRRGNRGSARSQTNLSAVQRDGGEGESGDVQGAVLNEATDVTHRPPEHPGAVHKADLREHTQAARLFMHPSVTKH